MYPKFAVQMEQQEQLAKIVDKIVTENPIHAKRRIAFLNDGGMFGARKISKYEDPIHSDIIVLKHAVEEARHAYYLKKLIAKVGPDSCPDYSHQYLLAPLQSHHYLNRLDTEACRYLKNTLNLQSRDLKHGAYLLVTYAIEVRVRICCMASTK